MRVPHPIPYQGSKRLLAPFILNYFPSGGVRLIEPFAGAAAVSIAAARNGNVGRIILSDVNSPLMELWKAIVNEPEIIADAYEKLWNAQLGKERAFYDVVRDKFNETGEPHRFLYLLARCVKASVRYNSKGQFNQSPDNRRKGMHPDTMRWHICAVSQLLKGRARFTTGDYRKTLETAKPEDVIYMDPPYQGVCLNRDSRYKEGLEFGTFTAALAGLNEKHISYILSYDGRTGQKSHGKPMPETLGLLRIEIDAGRSSQATLLGRNSNTFESVYLSPSLVERLGRVGGRELTVRSEQFNLLTPNVAAANNPTRVARTA
jgi:DNA adenine methylase